MKDQRLQDYLQGKSVDYVTPFYWQHGAEGRLWDIPTRMRELYEDGNRSVCVESRPHPNFGKEEWWNDMETVFSEAEKLGMKVWLMDTKHYPTGYISGFAERHPELRLWNITEKHIDVVGPVREGVMVFNPYNAEEDRLIGVYAYRRDAVSQDDLTAEVIDIGCDKYDGEVIWLDLPQGVWRVFAVFQTHKGVSDSFISVIDGQSVQVLVDEIYEEHYKRYEKYIGKTFVGFFSDEPRFRNQQIGGGRFEYGYYNKTVGMRAIGLPWSVEVLPMMAEELGSDVGKYLAALWYNVGDLTHKIRLAYMNAISRLYSKYFSQKLGDWCQRHGMLYIGHVIEDMGCHARTGNGNAHFYRAQEGQHMSGIDAVIQQVIPGFSHYDSTTSGGYCYADSTFYHYVLCQMAASHAHYNARMQGRAMGEIFAAYGWVEDVPMMKWQADYMLVRGINYFIPNGYDDTFPDADCPPQLGVRIDPQLIGYQRLTGYMNRMCHLLSGGVHVANAAVLYHAEHEWMNPQGFVDMGVPAKALLDANISYDILPADAICDLTSVENGKLLLAAERYDALFVSYGKHLPCNLIRRLAELHQMGLPIYFVEGTPDGCQGLGEEISANRIPELMYGNGFYDIKVEGRYPLLRHYHIRRENVDVYMFFNESVTDTVRTNVAFRQTGTCTIIDDLADRVTTQTSENGVLDLELEPYQSVIIVWNGGEALDEDPSQRYCVEETELSGEYDIQLANCLNMNDYQPLCKTHELFNITGKNREPHFSGRIKYTTTLQVDEAGDYLLDLGQVGQIASVSVNGVDCGLRICRPFVFDVGALLRAGENQLEITVSNTLFYDQRDPLSEVSLIPPSGLLGPVKIKKYEPKIKQTMKEGCT